MIDRRTFLAGVCAGGPVQPAIPRALRNLGLQFKGNHAFQSFLAVVRAKAYRIGLSSFTINNALSLSRPNPRVLELDRHQTEFNLTWSQYRPRVLTERKVRVGQLSYQRSLPLLKTISHQDGTDPGIICSIWGLESDYGRRTGSFKIVDALATLAFDGCRTHFFMSELLYALQILERGDVSFASMLGSYAGAMGQPQFMPSSYLQYAIDYDADGRRDIWATEADVFASISNYLKKHGWVVGEPWGQLVSLPSSLEGSTIERKVSHSLDTWMRMGVRRADGRRFSRADIIGSILSPNGAAGETFMVYNNFDVIKRYNPSDYYSLAVGLLGNAIV